MGNFDKASTFAAFTNGIVAIATLYVALILIGPDVLMDRSLFVEMAMNNPGPILLQDILKFCSAACMAILITALSRRLQNEAAARMRIASVTGFLSVLLLIVNAVVSLFATSQAGGSAGTGMADGNNLNQLITALAMASLFTSGLWYLLVSLTALKGRQLSKGLNYTGVAIGTLSLIPPAAIVALLLSVLWSFWLGTILAKDTPVKT